MKRMMKIVMGMVMCVGSFMANGQAKMDEQRMQQDIEVAENILSTLIRQQFGKRNFFPMEVHGNYLAGYGVTFRMPQGGPFNVFMIESMGGAELENHTSEGYSYSYSYKKSTTPKVAGDREKDCEDCEKQRTKVVMAPREEIKTSPKGDMRRVNSDSLSATADKRFLEVAKNFLADYGDVLSQLKPEEKIIITNRAEDFDGDFNFKWAMDSKSRRSLISAEAKRDDIVQLKQGKITRDQFLGKLKIVNTESSETLDPDLEVFSSMFGRLYRSDLSKTYYSQGNIYYERMKDFGVIYYMKVYSSEEEDNDHFSLPTVDAHHLSKPERDKKVKELYPKFESDLKDNLVEYGRTLRSLKDDEQLVMNVKLTRCENCGIPASIEVSVKNSALKDYSSGKASKDATLAKVNVKKVGSQ